MGITKHRARYMSLIAAAEGKLKAVEHGVHYVLNDIEDKKINTVDEVYDRLLKVVAESQVEG